MSTTDWQDADAAAGLAYAYHLPVVLTAGSSLSPQAAAELSKLGFDQVLAIGGPVVLSPAVVSAIEAIDVTVGGEPTPISVLRIAGSDAAGTSADLASFEGALLGWSNATLYVAQGTSQGAGWGDSLAAAPLVAEGHGALLLTAGPGVGLPSTLTTALVEAGTSPYGLGSGVTSSLQVLGGPLAVTPVQVAGLQRSLATG